MSAAPVAYPHAPVYRPGAQHGVRLASNESALGPSPSAIAAYTAATGDLHRYPEPTARALRRDLAERHGLDPERIVVGHGAEEVLSLVLRAYLRPGDELVIPATAFAWFALTARGLGADVWHAAETAFVANPDTLVRAVGDRTRVVALANPNNPTGTVLSRAALEDLRDRLPADVLLVVDEAYAELADAPWETALGWDRPDVVVVRTFSKAYGLAGARVGWMTGPADAVNAVNALRGPFNISRPAVEAARAALRDERWLARTVQHVRRERDFLTRGLGRAGLEVVPGHGNFVMVRCGSAERAQSLRERWGRAGLAVRPLDNYGLEDALRVSIGLRHDHVALLAAL